MSDEQGPSSSGPSIKILLRPDPEASGTSEGH